MESVAPDPGISETRSQALAGNGAHGIFDHEAKDRSITEWWRDHKAWVLAGTAATALAALVWGRR